MPKVEWFRGIRSRPLKSAAGQNVARSDWAFLVLTSAIVIYLSQAPLSWFSNEFHYFSQAVFSQGEFSSAFASGYTNQTNGVFQIFLRFLVAILGLEMAWFTARIAGILLLSFGLATLATSLRVNALALSVGLGLFLSTHQAYFGGEWIFVATDAKLFSYSLGFAGLGWALRNKWFLVWGSSPFLLLFHPLVGLSFFAVFLALMPWRSAARVRKSLVTIPPVVLLLFVSFQSLIMASGSTGSEELDARARFVYSAIRHPHHLVPFPVNNPDTGQVLGGWFDWPLLLPPILVSLSLMVVLWSTRGASRKLAKVMLLAHLWIPVALFLAFIDGESQFLGPLYMFRPLSVLLLVSLILVAGALIVTPPNVQSATAFVAIVFAFLLAAKPIADIGTVRGLQDHLAAGDTSLINEIQLRVKPSESVYADFGSFGGHTGLSEQNFELLVGRGQVAVWKFVPTRWIDVLKWHDAITARARLDGRTCTGQDFFIWDYGLFHESDISETVAAEGHLLGRGFVLIEFSKTRVEELCE